MIFVSLNPQVQNFHRERAVSRQMSNNSTASGATTPDSPSIRGLVSVLPDKGASNSHDDVMMQSTSTKEK